MHMAAILLKKEYNKFITLPLHADLTDEEVKFIVENLKKLNT